MTWGNNNAGPVGVQPFAPGIVGQPPGQAGATLPPFYNAGFESVMAAVSRGEVSLNQVMSATNSFGGIIGPNSGGAQGNPTLLQAISQGTPQNATNGIGVVSGPGVGAGGGPGIPAVVSGTGGATGAAVGSQLGPTTAFGGTQAIDAKQMMNVPALANPIQYGGN